MAFTLAQFIDKLRYRLDDREEPYLWSDAELVDYINIALAEFYRETLVKIDRSTFTISVVSGTQNYALDARIIRMVSIRSDLFDKFYEIKTTGEMSVNWRETTNTGDPSYYILDFEEGYLWLDVIPDDNDTLRLNVYSLPSAWMDAGTLTATFGISDERLLGLADGVLREAYQKPDPDSYDLGKSDRHGAKFAKYKGRVKYELVRLRRHENTIGVHEGTI